MEDNLKKKMEDDDKKNKKKRRRPKRIKWKTTSKKMENEPINQNQPNWL